MTARTTAHDAWKPLCHRGRFEMYVMTRGYVQEEHGAVVTTPYVAEIRADDGSAPLLHFASATSMAEFVGEMVPMVVEIHHATGEDVTELAASLQVAWNAARRGAKEVAEAAIARAARR